MYLMTKAEQIRMANTFDHVVCSSCGKDITKNIGEFGLEDGIKYVDYHCTCGNMETVSQVIWHE